MENPRGFSPGIFRGNPSVYDGWWKLGNLSGLSQFSWEFIDVKEDEPHWIKKAREEILKDPILKRYAIHSFGAFRNSSHIDEPRDEYPNSYDIAVIGYHDVHGKRIKLDECIPKEEIEKKKEFDELLDGIKKTFSSLKGG